jgi:hypothetical protein
MLALFGNYFNRQLNLEKFQISFRKISKRFY